MIILVDDSPSGDLLTYRPRHADTPQPVINTNSHTEHF
jgi:hypothetical protein